MAGNGIGKIKVLLYDSRNEKGVLYDVEVSKQKAHETIRNVKGRINITINGEADNLPKDFTKSAKNALKACEGLIERCSPDFLDSFNHFIFTLNLQCSYAKLNAEYSGESATFSMALAVLSSFFGFTIRDNVAATGTIDENGNIGLVYNIPQKLSPYIKQKSKKNITRFILPNLNKLAQSNPSDEISKIHDEVLSFERVAREKGQTIFYCDSFLSSLRYAITESEFEKLINDLHQNENGEELMAAFFPQSEKGIREDIDSNIIGLKGDVSFELKEKYEYLRNVSDRNPELLRGGTMRKPKRVIWIVVILIVVISAIVFGIKHISGNGDKLITTEKTGSTKQPVEPVVEKANTQGALAVGTSVSGKPNDLKPAKLTSKEEKQRFLKENYELKLLKAAKKEYTDRKGTISVQCVFTNTEIKPHNIGLIVVSKVVGGARYVLRCSKFLDYQMWDGKDIVISGESCYLAGANGSSENHYISVLAFLADDFLEIINLPDAKQLDYEYLTNNYPYLKTTPPKPVTVESNKR